MSTLLLEPCVGQKFSFEDKRLITKACEDQSELHEDCSVCLFFEFHVNGCVHFNCIKSQRRDKTSVYFEEMKS